jgi:hypothetical protein
MAIGATEHVESRNFKDAILVEIFNAYQETGMVYQKTSDPEIRKTVLDLKRCYDRAIQHLSPLGAHAEKLREELGTRFSA